MKRLYRYIFILGLFLLAQPAFASTCGVLPAGGNWNAAGTWHSCAGGIPLAGDKVVATSSAGNLVINANTNALESFDLSTYTGTLSGSNSLTIRGVAGVESQVIFGGTVTWTGALSLSNVTATAHLGLTTNGKALTTVTIGGNTSASTTLKDNLTFAGNANNLNILTLSGSKFDQGGFTISGASSTDRVRITSGTIGTSKQIINGGNYANANFQDIALTSSTDLSAITGLSGDCGGNTNITFTTATTTYWIGNSGNWSNVNEWAWNSGGTAGTSRVPLPQDNVVFDSNSFSTTGFTVTVDMSDIGKDVDFSLVGADNPTLTFINSGSFTSTVFGSFILDSGMTWTNISGHTMSYAGRGTHTIDLQGIIIPRPNTMYAYGGTYTLANDYISYSTFTLYNGTLTLGSYAMTGTLFSVSNTASSIVNANTGTFNVTGTGNLWSIGSLSTFNADTSTINISNTSTTLKTFAGNGKTYYNINFSGPNIVSSGANIYTGTMGINNAGFGTNLGLRFTSGATTTVANITTNATSTSDRSMASTTSSTSSAGFVKTGGGTICLDYINIQRLNADPVSTFYALSNSLDSGDNTNWTFGACPTTATPTAGELFIIEID